MKRDAPLYVWKFISRGRVACVIAETRERAITRLKTYALRDLEQDEHSRIDDEWLDGAQVTRIDADKPGLLCWVQF